jgi:hypothetical protein
MTDILPGQHECLFGSFDDDVLVEEPEQSTILLPVAATADPAIASLFGAPEGKSMLDWALAYARRGWAVFPVRTRDKKPATEHGHLDATTDEMQIQKWWAKNPRYNIGLATEPSGLSVIDLDFKHLAREEVAANVKQYLGPQVGIGLQVNTGGGGYQLYFADGRQPIRQFERGRVGIDLRSAGGYVVAPPSIHPNGRRYEWHKDAFERVLPALPDDVRAGLEVVRNLPNKKNDDAPTIRKPPVDLDDLTPFPTGEATSMLTRIAGSLRRKGLGEHTLRGALLEVNRRRNANRKSTLAEQETEIATLASSMAAKSLEAVEVDDAVNVVPFPELTPEEEDTMPERPWLIDGFIHQRAVVELYGLPKTCKTFVAQSLAWCVASDAIFLGRKIVKPGNVIYALLEGYDDIGRRKRAWRKANPDARFDRHRVRFLKLDNPADRFSLLDSTAILRIVANIRQANAVMCVIDTRSRAALGVEDHDNERSQKVVEACERIRNATACTVLSVHHAGKTTGTNKGNQMFQAFADTMILAAIVTAEGKPVEPNRIPHLLPSERRYVLRCADQRIGRPFDEIPYDVTDIDGPQTNSGVVVSPESAANAVGTPPEHLRGSLGALLRLCATEMSFVTTKDWRKATGLTERTFTSHATDLRQMGWTTRDGSDGKNRHALHRASGKAWTWWLTVGGGSVQSAMDLLQ